MKSIMDYFLGFSLCYNNSIIRLNLICSFILHHKIQTIGLNSINLLSIEHVCTNNLRLTDLLVNYSL
jgi:hypothetical protein